MRKGVNFHRLANEWGSISRFVSTLCVWVVGKKPANWMHLRACTTHVAPPLIRLHFTIAANLLPEIANLLPKLFTHIGFVMAKCFVQRFWFGLLEGSCRSYGFAIGLMKRDHWHGMPYLLFNLSRKVMEVASASQWEHSSDWCWTECEEGYHLFEILCKS